MEPISFNSPLQEAADQSVQRAAVAQQLFKIRDLFATISLMSDPKTSLSLLCYSNEIYRSYTCTKEIVNSDTGEEEIFKPDESAFEEVNEIFNGCTGSKIANGVSRDKISPSEHLKQHQLHFDSILRAVKQRMESRGMATDLEMGHLCWGDLPLMKKWIAASDKLQVWKLLAKAIDVKKPSAANFTEINSCIAEADKFSEWFGKNIGKLAGLEFLSLGYNELAVLPPEIGQLTGLKWLNLSRNQLTALPSEIGQLTGLQELNLSCNEFAALPPEICRLTELKELNLSFNPLTALPCAIGQLAGLKALFLSNTRLNELPVELGQLAQLQFLHLKGCQIDAMFDVINQLEDSGCFVRWLK